MPIILPAATSILRISRNFSVGRAKFARTGQRIGIGADGSLPYNQTQSNPLTEARKCSSPDRVVFFCDFRDFRVREKGDKRTKLPPP